MGETKTGKDGKAFKLKDDGTIVWIDEHDDPSNSSNNDKSSGGKKTGWIWFLLVLAVGAIVVAIVNSTSTVPSNNYNTTVVRSGDSNVIVFSTINEDFQEFIQNFKSDEDFQLSRIQFSQIEETRDSWYTWDDRFIFEGFRNINGEQYEGKFLQLGDKWEYQLGVPYSDWFAKLTFSRINGEWYMVRFVDFKSTPDNMGE